MKTLELARQKKLIKQAHAHLDIIEKELKFIFDSIKAKRSKKAA
jgi:hypothetical protein